MNLQNDIKEELKAFIEVPNHIHACANAIRYDLLNSPSYSYVPFGDISRFNVDCYATFYEDLVECVQEGDSVANITETYTGIVAKTLRSFIDGLPCALYVDEDFGSVLEDEPKAYYDEEDEEYFEPGEYYELNTNNILEILFGTTIAREFR